MIGEDIFDHELFNVENESTEDAIYSGFSIYLLASITVNYYNDIRDNKGSGILATGLERDIEILDYDNAGNPISYEYMYMFDDFSQLQDSDYYHFSTSPTKISGTFTEIQKETNNFRYTEREILDVVIEFNDLIENDTLTKHIEITLIYNLYGKEVDFEYFEKFIVDDEEFTNDQVTDLLFKIY